MRCPACGEEAADPQRFCGACGQPLATHVCPACGAATAEDARFCGDCGASLAAERRQLTIAFVDLVGSTALARRLDPEDLQDVIRTYQRAVAGVVERYQGSVAQFLGDGVLAYFGHPHALENTAESAVRASLEVVEAVHGLTLPQNVALAVRIGIATGLVVIGDVGSGAIAERLAIGDTPNLAARIQALAPEDAVLVSHSTRRLLGEHFVLDDLGEHVLKGIDAPVRVWKVRAEGRAATRFEATHAGAAAPLLGRAEELQRITDAWRAVGAGGRIVLIRGEAGMGKSRLLLAALDAPETRQAATISLQCSPYHAQSAFFPLVAWLRGRLETAPSPERRLLEMLDRAGIGRDGVRRFADLLAADFASRHPPTHGTPEHERRETARGFLALLLAAAEEQPLLLAMEDLHWADPSTLGFVDLLSERVATLPVLLLASARPVFVPPWAARANVVHVEHLPPAAAAALVTATAGRALSPELVDRIVAHTDGVPLFVEELTRTVVESAADAALPVAEVAATLPPTLRDSLTLRLDRLQSGKPVAQLAAMLGRHFDGRVLRAVWHGSEAKLGRGVAELLAATLVFGAPWPSDGRYAFKHALVQEAAYESLLRRERTAQHARIASVLEECFPDLVANQPEVVARHHAAGLAWEQATTRWLQAGHRALGHHAHLEAIGHLEAALEAIGNLPDDPVRGDLEAEAQLALLPALITARGYGHPRVEAVGARCVRLCEAVGDPMRRFTALFPMCTFHMVRANHAEALRLAEELHALAETTRDDDLRIEASLVLGLCRFFGGDLGQADRHLDACLARYDAGRRGGHAQRFGQDPAVVAESYRSWIRWIDGEQAASYEASCRALGRARAADHPLSVAFALAFAAWRSVYGRDGARARPWIEELLGHCARQAIPLFEIHGRLQAAWLDCEEGHVREGAPRFRAALEDFEATGSQCYLSLWLAFLAVAEAEAGDPAAARQTVARALAEMARSGEAWSRPEVLRLAAVVRRAASADGTEALLAEAVEVAAAQGARTWELRAGRDLAETLWRRGRRADARARLDALIGRVALDASDPEAMTAVRLRNAFDSPPSGRSS